MPLARVSRLGQPHSTGRRAQISGQGDHSAMAKSRAQRAGQGDHPALAVGRREQGVAGRRKRVAERGGTASGPARMEAERIRPPRRGSSASRSAEERRRGRRGWNRSVSARRGWGATRRGRHEWMRSGASGRGWPNSIAEGVRRGWGSGGGHPRGRRAESNGMDGEGGVWAPHVSAWRGTRVSGRSSWLC